MKIEQKTLTDRIHLLIFETQKDITSTFLRFQEHYESPEFRGKVFSLDEFKGWYVQNSPNGIKSGDFTYYSDWNGFNIPSHVLMPFYENKFDPLSPEEMKILEIFQNKDHPYYIIGVHKENKNPEGLLEHEIAHGLFTTNPEYKNEVISLLSKYDVEPIKKELRLKGGYHEEVLDDEVHAYSLGRGSGLETPTPDDLANNLRLIYKKYFIGSIL